MYSPDGWLRSG